MTRTTARQAKRTELRSASGMLQRSCACGNRTIAGGECAECAKDGQSLSREAHSQNELTGVPSAVHEVLSSPGKPLDARTRAFMEPRFGHDFSDVRIHSDARASESAAQVHAYAYTVGQHIIFGSGRYDVASTDGTILLAHELTHTLQQSRGGALSLPRQSRALQVSEPDDAHEREAAVFAERIARSQTPADGNHSQEPSTSMLPAPTLFRDPQPDFVPDNQGPDEKGQEQNKPLIPIPIFDQADPTVITPDIPGLPGLVKGKPVHLSTLKQALDILRGKKPDSGQNDGDCARFGMEKAQLGPLKGQCCKKEKRDSNSCCRFNDIGFRSGRCCTMEEVLFPDGVCTKPKRAPLTLPPSVEKPQLQDAPQRILPEGTEYA